MIALQTLYEQIEEQGREWGLVPVWRGPDRVGVAEVVHELHPQRRKGRVQVMDEGLCVLASWDTSAPLDAFSIFLAKRLHRHQHDFMKLVRARQDRLARERQANLEQMKRDMRAQYGAKFQRSRTLFGPGITPRERVW